MNKNYARQRIAETLREAFNKYHIELTKNRMKAIGDLEKNPHVKKLRKLHQELKEVTKQLDKAGISIPYQFDRLSESPDNFEVSITYNHPIKRQINEESARAHEKFQALQVQLMDELMLGNSDAVKFLSSLNERVKELLKTL